MSQQQEVHIVLVSNDPQRVYIDFLIEDFSNYV
jgi:hypothetical protein